LSVTVSGNYDHFILGTSKFHLPGTA
jgi:hypothetical protein